MNKKVAMKHHPRASALIASMTAALLLSACASAPIPTVPDGANRVPVNNPERVSQFQQESAAKLEATENWLILRAQVATLTRQFEDLRSVVKSALLLPKSPEKAEVQISPVIRPTAVAPSAVSSYQFPERTVERGADGVIVRQFHGLGQTQFQPSANLAAVLRASARDAKTIEICGFTDSPVADEVNQRVALGRAVSARQWFIASGVPADRIRTRYKSAGDFLVENETESGRAMNRRVEVQLQGLAGAKVTALYFGGQK